MTSPNARIALQRSPTYEVLPLHLRQQWLNYLASLGPLADPPREEEEFEDVKHYLKRLNV